MVDFDAGRIHRGELVAAGGAVLLLAALFILTWFRGGSPPSVSLDGWQALSTIRWLLLLTVAACAALVLLTASERAPALPVTASLVTLLLGDLSAVALLFRVIDHPGLHSQIGVYVGLVAALAIGYGGYLSLRTESSPFGDPESIETVSLAPSRTSSTEPTESTPAGRSEP